MVGIVPEEADYLLRAAAVLNRLQTLVDLQVDWSAIYHLLQQQLSEVKKILSQLIATSSVRQPLQARALHGLTGDLDLCRECAALHQLLEGVDAGKTPRRRAHRIRTSASIFRCAERWMRVLSWYLRVVLCEQRAQSLLFLKRKVAAIVGALGGGDGQIATIAELDHG